MGVAAGGGSSGYQSKEALDQKVSIREINLEEEYFARKRQLERELGHYCDAYSMRRKAIPFSGEIREVQTGGFVVGNEFLDYENLMQVFVHDRK